MTKKTDPAKAAEEIGARYGKLWGKSKVITPRQAYAIALQLDLCADRIDQWLGSPDEPLHTAGLFELFDLRVMMLVDENRAFSAAVRDRCSALSREMDAGVLPFDRPGCFMDEVLFAVALQAAAVYTTEAPDSVDAAPAHAGDDDWDGLRDRLDDAAHSADWEAPRGLPALQLLLTHRHPFSWFDVHGEMPAYSLSAEWLGRQVSA